MTCTCNEPGARRTKVCPKCSPLRDGALARQIDILRRAASVPVPDDDSGFSVAGARSDAASWRCIATNVVAAYDAGTVTDELSERLKDPAVVHINMLRGGIAKPTPTQIGHLYRGAEAVEVVNELKRQNPEVFDG